jgi:hypothetical protein
MAWVKIDDGFSEHPKVLRAGPLAVALHIAALCYAARQRTDGFIPGAVVSRLVDIRKPAAEVARLVQAGLWESVEGGYAIHDYLAYNPSREQIDAERAATAERVKRWRDARSNGVTNAGVTPGVTLPPSRPVPTRGTSVPASDARRAAKGELTAAGEWITTWSAHTGRTLNRAEYAAAVALTDQGRDTAELPELALWMDKSPYHGQATSLDSIEKNWPSFLSERESGQCRHGNISQYRQPETERIYRDRTGTKTA